TFSSLAARISSSDMVTNFQGARLIIDAAKVESERYLHFADEIFAIDGKSICCTVTDYSQSCQKFINIVSVFSPERIIVSQMQAFETG
ncbi:MAG: hypothetical protein ACYT04_78880, partial [Nostoc sp.]